MKQLSRIRTKYYMFYQINDNYFQFSTNPTNNVIKKISCGNQIENNCPIEIDLKFCTHRDQIPNMYHV